MPVPSSCNCSRYLGGASAIQYATASWISCSASCCPFRDLCPVARSPVAIRPPRLVLESLLPPFVPVFMCGLFICVGLWVLRRAARMTCDRCGLGQRTAGDPSCPIVSRASCRMRSRARWGTDGVVSSARACCAEYRQRLRQQGVNMEKGLSEEKNTPRNSPALCVEPCKFDVSSPAFGPATSVDARPTFRMKHRRTRFMRGIWS